MAPEWRVREVEGQRTNPRQMPELMSLASQEPGERTEATGPSSVARGLQSLPTVARMHFHELLYVWTEG